MWTLIIECIILVGKTCKRHISKTELHIATGLHWENEAANVLATCLLKQTTLWYWICVEFEFCMWKFDADDHSVSRFQETMNDMMQISQVYFILPSHFARIASYHRKCVILVKHIKLQI